MDSTNSSAMPSASITLSGDTARAYAVKRLQKQQAAQGKQRNGTMAPTVKIPGVAKPKGPPGMPKGSRIY